MKSIKKEFSRKNVSRLKITIYSTYAPNCRDLSYHMENLRRTGPNKKSFSLLVQPIFILFLERVSNATF